MNNILEYIDNYLPLFISISIFVLIVITKRLLKRRKKIKINKLLKSLKKNGDEIEVWIELFVLVSSEPESIVKIITEKIDNRFEYLIREKITQPDKSGLKKIFYHPHYEKFKGVFQHLLSDLTLNQFFCLEGVAEEVEDE